MTKTIFGPAEIAIWNDLLDSRKPRMIEEIEWPAFPQIEAFRPIALNAGIALRMAVRESDAEVEILLNPVAARHLAANILKMGMEAGWLTELGDVICPPLPPLDS